METLRLTKNDLLERYDDPEWRGRFWETTHLVNFLNDCILIENYKIPDELPSVVPLTEYGSEVMNKLVRKNDVNAKVARLLCLLAQVHREPLVDFDAIDVEALRQMIDSQTRERQIQFPFVLGRELYDRAATLFEEPRNVLSHVDTLALLEDLPIGVFQSGSFVSGPFGILRSSQERFFGPNTAVPLYHCAELTCRSVHRTHLSSDYTAPVNVNQSVMRRVLDSYGDDESDWVEFIDEIAKRSGVEFDDRSDEPTILALGDLLGNDELRVLLTDLLDNTQGRLRAACEPLGLVGRASDISENLQRAELIQLILLTANVDVVSRIDHLVLRGSDEVEASEPAIRVSDGETRRLMVNQRAGFGVFGLFPEISSLGVRFQSDTYSLAPMRLKRLVQSLYNFESSDDIAELEWQLRSVEGEDPLAKVEEFVLSASPEEVVRQLVLARRANHLLAAGEFGIPVDKDDDRFVRKVLWKLGFYATHSMDPTIEFWQHYERLKRFVDTAGVGGRLDTVELRSKAINCFVALEGVLDDALAFSTWALTVDHLSSARPFAYAPWEERRPMFDVLNGVTRDKRVRHEELQPLGEKNVLSSLIQGLGALADDLRGRREQSAVHVRPEEDLPRYVNSTDLKKFPFRHKVPFLDLLPSSQERILESLEYGRKTLELAETASVRNDFGHYRATLPDLSRVEGALVAMDRVVRRFEGDGLIRLPFEVVRDEGDDWGRKVITFRNSKGREVAFARPTAFDWAQMPRLRGVQYVVPSAVFARPNEMLRFRLVHDTSYAEYWSDFPKRRKKRGSLGGTALAGDVGPQSSRS